MQSRANVIHSAWKTSVFLSYYSRCSFLHYFLFSFSSSYASFHTVPSFLNVTVLHYNIFAKTVYQWQLALSRLMRGIYCGSAVFPGDCAALHNIKFEVIKHSACITSCKLFHSNFTLINDVFNYFVFYVCFLNFSSKFTTNIRGRQITGRRKFSLIRHLIIFYFLMNSRL